MPHDCAGISCADPTPPTTHPPPPPPLLPSRFATPQVDIDVGNFKGSRFSVVAKRIIDAVCPRVAKFVIDLAFMMQGEEEDELPERLIGTVRLIRLDLAGPSSKVSHQNRGGGHCA